MGNSTALKWFSFDHRRVHDFVDEPALCCFIGKLCHRWQGYSAWRGTWSETYSWDESFALDLGESKRRIERNRTQGSQWTIAELPVLVIAGADNVLVVGEINTDSPLSNVSMPRTFDRSLESFAQLFRPLRPTQSIASSERVPACHLPIFRFAVTVQKASEAITN